MLHQIQLACPLCDSFRVQQIAGMFDVPLDEKLTEEFTVEIPALDSFPWQIGLIVGPSGSGKTTLARSLFGKRFIEHIRWPNDRAVIDCIDQGIQVSGYRIQENQHAKSTGDSKMSIRDTINLLTAVGFSSPPSWIKPYHVLSRGERFRCDLARALAAAATTSQFLPNTEPRPLNPLVAFDEFTSLVDRRVARFGSAAIAKAIHSGRVRTQFVAVTCHYDVLDWLAPDWVIDMATREFVRRSLRRRPIPLEVQRCHRSEWRRFARHHYLNGALNPSAQCYVALWRDRSVVNDHLPFATDERPLAMASETDLHPVALCATLPIMGRKNHRRITRLVTLPDFQGLGIGMRLAETVAEFHRAQGQRVNITGSHPSLIAHCRRSPKWRVVQVRKTGAGRHSDFGAHCRTSIGRAVVSFEYEGSGFGVQQRWKEFFARINSSPNDPTLEITYTKPALVS
ncbi:MAG: ATP-binding cassette domain-containing protein [Pirellulales bacterium]|nr:ATP-binding cassette domain-containing protein [Pirellulales bacterium]